jgi:hypothetical protein
VKFGVEIGEHRVVVQVPRRVLQQLLRSDPPPSVEAHYLQRTRFESIAERKLRRRQLTDDGNVEISGRDLRLSTGWKRADSQRSVSNRPSADLHDLASG